MSRSRKAREYPKYKGKKKGSDLKFCSCRACKYGLHHGGWGMFVAEEKRKAVRHRVRQILKYGYPEVEEEILKVNVGVTYTD